MTRLREEFDADRAAENNMTAFRTEENRYEVLCENCGTALYVNEETHRDRQRAAEHGHAEPVVCPDCEEAANEAAFN